MTTYRQFVSAEMKNRGSGVCPKEHMKVIAKKWRDGKAGQGVDQGTQTENTDQLTLDVPLFIRLLEYAKEDAKTDMDLHKLTENALNLKKGLLTMDDYDKIIDVSSSGAGMNEGEGIIPAKDKIYLLLSQEAYEPKNNRKATITASGETFKYDKRLSDLRTAIYHSPTRLIIAHRGTVPTDEEDLSADLFIAKDDFANSPRARHALEKANKAIKKYKKLTVSNTGHSLGGSTAQYVGSQMTLDNAKVVSFNAGSSPYNLKKSIFKWLRCKVLSRSDECKRQRMQTLYTTIADPIAFWQLPLSTVIKAEKWNPHSMENYIPEEEEVQPPAPRRRRRRAT